MDLKLLRNNEIENRIKAKSAEERKLTLEVIELLEEVDRRKIHLQRGYGSLLDYCVKELKYSESSAYRRISAMRVVREVPEVKSKIEAGSLNLMNLAQAQTYFRKSKVIVEEKKQLLANLENKSKRETEKILVLLNPDVLPKESVRAVTDTISRVTLAVDDELLAKLNKLKNLLSHKLPNGQLIDVISHIADLAIKKLDPIVKPLRKATPPVKSENIRHITVKARQEVWEKSESQCCFVDALTGKRCESKRFLEIDHIHAYSRGGSREVSNLQLLCDAHNRMKSNR